MFRNESERPRVLGLTASPLLSVKKNHSDEQIDGMLDELEDALDSKIVSMGQHNVSIDVDGGDIEFLTDDVEEREVFYGDCNATCPSVDMPLAEGVHEKRAKEFAFYGGIQDNLGPLPLQLMVQSVLANMSRNAYEKESEQELGCARDFLQRMLAFCQKQRQNYPDGISGKLWVLSSLLRRELSNDHAAVGVVFVERRLTAFALNLYFKYLVQEQTTSPSQASPRHEDLDNVFGQFMDADGDIDQSKKAFVVARSESSKMSAVRSAYLVRSTHQPKISSRGVPGRESTESTIQNFKARIINCLICTSIAEEGLDIQSCSFAIAFDGISSSKRYIQVKGRVRHQNGRFYLMNHRSPQPSSESGSKLILSDLRVIALNINRAILRRSTMSKSYVFRLTSVPDNPSGEENLDYQQIELRAATEGVYRTTGGEMSKLSAKSLLYRFYLCQKMEKTDRKFREMMDKRLPRFSFSLNQFSLILPGHIEPRLRRITLPDEFSGEPQRKQVGILSLMACVRLHRHGLLTDQLLPLTKESIAARISTVIESHQVYTPKPTKNPNYAGIFFAYKLTLNGGSELQQVRESLQSCVSLAIITQCCVMDLPSHHYHHAQFGALGSQLYPIEHITLSVDETRLVSDFFATIMNARWNKRNGDILLRPCNNRDLLVAAIHDDGSLNFELMEKVVHEGTRSETVRKDAVLEASLAGHLMFRPRLWTKIVQPSPVYIAHHLHDNIKISRDSNSSTKEFVCTMMWKAPRAMFRYQTKKEESGSAKSTCETPDSSTIMCRPLDCIELPVSDPGLLLEIILLPQVLYVVERQMVAQDFIKHCSTNFPTLAEALMKIGWREIRRLLTSTRSQMPETYERFEWLGDGVVKLLVTQLCNEKNEIATWVKNFHEGNLSELRGAVVSNDQLAKVCRNARLDHFLLTTPLRQEIWTPCSLERCHVRTEEEIRDNYSPSLKTCADFIEGVIGAVFHAFGFEIARNVAIEIHVVPASKSSALQHFAITSQHQSQEVTDAVLFRRIERAVGIAPCSNLTLYKQAFCHSSNLDEQFKSNEVLEWIGDAVLTVAIRSWIFDRFDLSPGHLTQIESAIVSNDTLSFVAVLHGLHRLLMHQDETLPKRINAYATVLANTKMTTLWTANPPKPVADVVEALLGAVYLDRGHGQATEATYHCFAPVLRYFASIDDEGIEKLRHPKTKVRAFGGSLFAFRWSSVAGKSGVEISISGRPIGFVPGSNPTPTQTLATALLLRLIQKNSFLREKVSKIRTLAVDY